MCFPSGDNAGSHMCRERCLPAAETTAEPARPRRACCAFDECRKSGDLASAGIVDEKWCILVLERHLARSPIAGSQDSVVRDSHWRSDVDKPHFAGTALSECKSRPV